MSNGYHESVPCPYCGTVGYHIWAGSGGCPGAVPERERDGAAAFVIRELTAENMRLQFVIGKYVTLCTRAADAMEELINRPPLYAGDPNGYWALIADLRKVTE